MKLKIYIFFFIIMSNLIFSDEFGNKIILLYQSIDGQTEKDNLTAWHIAPILKEFGYDIVYVDINKKLPEIQTLKNDTYAVIGWLSNNSRVKPLELINWYEDLILNDIKLILIGALGCWQDAESKNYISDAEINKIFIKLGVIYKGNWTNQGSILKLEYLNNEIYKNFEIPQNIDYFLFLPLNNEVKSHIVLSRKDTVNSNSILAFSSDKGGYIFTNQYILKDLKFLLDLKQFLISSLFMHDNEQKILISGNDENFIEKAKTIFKLAKININSAAFNKFILSNRNNLSKYNIIILNNIDFNKVDDKTIELLNDYAKKGGSLFITGGKLSKKSYDLTGIKSIINPKQEINKQIKFSNKIYPDADKINYLFIPPENDKYLIEYELNKDCELLVHGQILNNMGKQLPIAWKKNHEKGNVIVWTGEIYKENMMNTVFFQTSLLTAKTSVQFFANIGVMFLDDFPIPTYNIIRDANPIPNKEDIDDTDFMINYAIPDIVNILKRYKIPLSSFIIFSYDDSITAPFKNEEFLLGKNNAYKKMINFLTDNKVEIGLHGYNHQSLSLNSTVTKKWNNIQDMIDSLKIAKQNFYYLFGYNYEPFSYVAPMNVIDDAGIKALNSVFPSIKVISTLYAPQEDSYETDMTWGIIPDTDILKMPRTSFGLHYNEEFLLNLQKGIWNYGIWPHFFHLDDSYDNTRSKGTQWPDLIKDFEKQLNYVKTNYPFLRYLTCKDAYYIMLDYEHTNYIFNISEDYKTITIKIPNGSSQYKYFIINMPDKLKLKNIENGKLEYIFPSNDRILIKTNAYDTKIIFE